MAFNGLRSLLDPSIALPMAGAMMSGPTTAQGIGNAFILAGQGMGTRRDEQKRLLEMNKTFQYLQQTNPELAQMVQAGMPVAEAWKMIAEDRKLKAQAPNPPDVKEFFDENTGQPYKAQWNPQNQSWDRIGGVKQSNSGFEVSLPDGTTVRQGAFGSQDQKNLANRVSTEQDAAATAANLKQTVQMLREANSNVGYSGVGGNIYGAVDDTLEQLGAPSLPGNARSRATIRSGGLQVALANVAKTKGAISNKEMELFMAASPGLQNTPQGNAALLDMIDAIADRQIMRVQQMEQWRQQYGTLDGFEGAWGQYIQANPLIVNDGSGSISLNGGAGQSSSPRRFRYNPQTGMLE